NLPAGTSPNAAALTQPGTFTVTAADGISAIQIGATSYTYAQLAASGSTNLVINGPHGTLTINGYTGTAAGGTVSYSYVLTSAAANAAGSDQATDSFTVKVTDSNGSTATDSLDVTIIDDKPQAHDDTGNIGEDAASVTVVAASGVLSNDVAGADGGKTVTTTGSFTGTYGTLVLNGDGSYTYTLKTDAATQATIQALTPGQHLNDTFNYTMKDGDGDTSPAKLVISIDGADDGVTLGGLNVAGGEETVYESNLPAGTSPNGAALTQPGTFTVTAADGISAIQIGATSYTYAQLAASGGTNLVINGPHGTLTINGYTGTAAGGTVSYSYVLTSAAANAAGSDQATDSFTVKVTDSNGSTATDSLDVTIIDDKPQAHDDTGSIGEDAASV
ncbi:VCBS domain-containing protein, partial [Afipia sp. NBIMC_P1-C1]|uniref:VCBS domain-containing protein n=1 Tax=Afipia sp. NBIMC_P1-C1 TaxID=1320552 RepID=UPI00054F84D2